MYDKEKGLYVAHGPEGPITICGKMANRHGLIAGATGSGKSVCINSFIVSLLYNANPDEVKLLKKVPEVCARGLELIKAHYNSDVRVTTVSVRLLENFITYCRLLKEPRMQPSRRIQGQV